MNNDDLITRINAFLRTKIKPRLQQHDQLKDVIVWVDEYKPQHKVVYLGLALGKGTGCSPFCGCAANQLADQIGNFLLSAFPNEVNAVVGRAILPPDDMKTAWKNA